MKTRMTTPFTYNCGERNFMWDRLLLFTDAETFPLYMCAVGNMQIIHFKIHFGLRSVVSFAFWCLHK